MIFNQDLPAEAGLLPHPQPFSLARRREIEERVEVPHAGDLWGETFAIGSRD
jgi:hypothetical protein